MMGQKFVAKVMEIEEGKLGDYSDHGWMTSTR